MQLAYEKYLGMYYKPILKQNIYYSRNRHVKLNRKHYTPIIKTFINQKEIISIDPLFEISYEDMMLAFEDRLAGYQLEERLRLVRTKAFKDIKCCVMTRNGLVENLKNRNPAYRRYQLLRASDDLKLGKKFVMKCDGEFVAYAKITEVIENYGNIAVYTNPDFRHKGYGKEVVKACVNWCLDRNIIPNYWVDVKNTHSLQLARSLGFKEISREYVIKEIK